MRDMVGQREVAARLEIALNSTKKSGETLGHILFDGPPGLGKTTFATVIPREHIIRVGDPKAIIDVLLGALAIADGKVDLDTYVSRRMAYNHYFGAKAGTAPKKA